MGWFTPIMANRMKYRRFGRTNLDISVLSCGGMGFNQTWDDLDFSKVTGESQRNAEATIHAALDAGINHLETARGYGTSERQLRPILNEVPRDRYHLQTKVTPCEDATEFERALQTSMERLGADYLDLIGFHGINLPEHIDWILRPGGCMEVVRRYQKDGRIRFVGFSTHGYCETIVRAIETGEFDYVNLHWYYINQWNGPAVDAAARQDMGVFIISPADKGGQLYKPTEKLVNLCAPLTPMAFNDLFCLRRPEVHTLSVGAARPTDFDAHLDALEHYENIDATIAPIEARIHAAMTDALGADWWPDYVNGLPTHSEVPGGVNLRYILRLWSLAKALDMHEYGVYRYAMIGEGGHWMPGNPASDFDEAAMRACLKAHPCADRIIPALREADAWFAGEKRKPQASH